MPLRTVLIIPERVYVGLIQHLLPTDAELEEAAFVFTNFAWTAGELKLEYKDWYSVPADGFSIRSLGYIELTDDVRASVIKRAHDLNAALVEFHSHPYEWSARFSWSDLEGLDEFVSHIMWRLKGRPYTAVVVAPSGFDALIWADDSKKPEILSEMWIDKRILRPNGLTLRSGRYT